MTNEEMTLKIAALEGELKSLREMVALLLAQAQPQPYVSMPYYQPGMPAYSPSPGYPGLPEPPWVQTTPAPAVVRVRYIP